MEPISKIKCDVCKNHFTHEYNTPLRDEDKLPEEATINQLVIHHMTWPTTSVKPEAFNIATIQEKVVYRTFPADYLVANDALVIYEIVRNDYTESKCLFTDWNPISRDHEESLIESFTEHYTIIHGGNENLGNMFSVYGWEPTNTVYVLYSQSVGTPYSKFTPVISEEASTGIHAIDAACQQNHTEIKCIGFDSVTEKGNYRNLYEGTENYRRDGEKYTPQKADLWEKHHSLIKKHYGKVDIEYLS